MCHYIGGYDVILMLKLWDIVLVFVSNEITVEHPLISAQPTTTNTVEYITSPAKQHIPQRRTAAWPGGVEREESSKTFATMNASPPRNFLSFEKRKNFRLSDEVNRGVLLSVCRIIVGFLDEI